MPSIPHCDPDHLPADLLALPQFLCWRYEERDGKATKVPVNPRTGRLALTTAPSTWATVEEAWPYARRHGLGLGFVFAATDPFVGIDLDKCIADGRLLPWAWAILAALDSYTEVSPSATGTHTFVRATLPPGGKRAGAVELYDRARFFTLTGARLDYLPPTVEERQAPLAALHARLFPPAPPAPPAASGPVPLRSWDDAEVVQRAMAATNGHKFAQLWLNSGHRYTSESEADAALVSLLAFWTGPDADRIDALFRQSGRMRPKWERASYRDRTIALALKRAEYYRPRAATGGLLVVGSRRGA
jgi:primase-polymerase (primpol)-like protein